MLLMAPHSCMEMERKMRLVYGCMLLLLILGPLILGACGQEVATVPAASETEALSPLPTATMQAARDPATASPDLTPSADRGIVQGTLKIGGELAKGQTLYLVPIVASGESMSVAGLDTNTAPRAETDTTGAFAFLNVPPGEYALAVVGPVGPVIVPGPDGDEITVMVQAGETTDLGSIAAPPFN